MTSKESCPKPTNTNQGLKGRWDEREKGEGSLRQKLGRATAPEDVLGLPPRVNCLLETRMLTRGRLHLRFTAWNCFTAQPLKPVTIIHPPREWGRNPNPGATVNCWHTCTIVICRGPAAAFFWGNTGFSWKIRLPELPLLVHFLHDAGCLFSHYARKCNQSWAHKLYLHLLSESGTLGWDDRGEGRRMFEERYPRARAPTPYWG